MGWEGCRVTPEVNVDMEGEVGGGCKEGGRTDLQEMDV